MQFPSLTALFQHIKTAWLRFPAASVLAIACMIASIIFVERNEGGQAEAWLIRIIMTTALGVPLLLSTSIASESYGWSLQKTWAFRGLALLALLGYFLTLKVAPDYDAPTDGFRFFALALAVHCGVAVSAYLNRKGDSVLSFWKFNKLLLAEWMVAAFYGLVLYVGISLAILGIDQLFNLDWSWRIYLHLFTVIAVGFHPLYFLSQVPKDYALSEDDPSYNAAIRNLVKYILIPLTLLYLLILYAYILKIGIEWAWPKGYVSSLSLGFSLVGILTYLLNYRLVETDDSTFLAWFRRWFFYLLSPVVPVLLLAVWRRLNDYGITEPRYFVATLGIWLFLVCLYFIVSKKDDIRFIPLSLGVIAFLSIVGPWSATAVSCRSQFGQLEALLNKSGALVNSKAQPGKGTVNDDERQRLYSIINYLSERDAMKPAQTWFGSELDSVFQKRTSRYDVSRILIEHLKLEAASSNQKSGSFSFGRLTGSLPAKGFEKLFKIELSLDAKQDFKADSIQFSLTKDASIVLASGKTRAAFDLKPYLQKMLAKYTDEFYYATIEDPADAAVSLKSERFEILLIPEVIDYEITQQQTRVNNIRGTLLVKPRK
ncbi:MAG: DUF4153 domain-containing protein [Saprospiraceae bacterium]|nr:DUF4153 domain-containing protein [Saprospiraceae bacterium]MDZ4704335.1 DUF4153 domain-containing protein [Saprospiraceae bacterium]